MLVVRTLVYVAYRHSTISLIDRPRASVDHGATSSVQIVAELWITFIHVRRERIAAWNRKNTRRKVILSLFLY